MAEAVGILEVFGLATAFVAADAGCKAANVHLEECGQPASTASCLHQVPRKRVRCHGSGRSRHESRREHDRRGTALHNPQPGTRYTENAENQRPG